ncbi:MAG: glycosyltransferase family 2 protein [Bacteroides sp.]|nr:glycosyltransferase family 2 protein [Bacteroides sp.]
MNSIHIITPVKDSIDLTLQTAEAIMASELTLPFTYTIYNDFSTPENTLRLQEAAERLGFRLVNLADVTDHPSPNYLLVLQTAQREALQDEAALVIVESDVLVKPDTLQALVDGARQRIDCGMAAAVTVDEEGRINFPYLYAKGRENAVFATRKRFSFCCTLLTPAYLQAFDFHLLNPEKHWHDVTISHQSLKHGFKNYLFTNLPVWHRPHGSRPWKQLKYTNPLKYYWLKFTKGLDKI